MKFMRNINIYIFFVLNTSFYFWAPWKTGRRFTTRLEWSKKRIYIDNINYQHVSWMRLLIASEFEQNLSKQFWKFWIINIFSPGFIDLLVISTVWRSLFRFVCFTIYRTSFFVHTTCKTVFPDHWIVIQKERNILWIDFFLYQTLHPSKWSTCVDFCTGAVISIN